MQALSSSLRLAVPMGMHSRSRVTRVPHRQQRLSTVVVPRAEGQSANYIKEEPGLSKISFGSVLLPVGLGLLIYGFGGYFTLWPGGDISALLLIYGFPITLIGFALKYAELAPVELRVTPEAVALRESQQTDIQKQVKDDCTRYRYGDEQHLEEALARIFLFGRQGGVPKRSAPTLVGLREETREGRYTLVLEFVSKELTEEQWSDRLPKFKSFFGPGIEAALAKTAQGFDVALISDGSGAGRGGAERKDVLPPLMPGLKPRVNNLD